MRRGTFIAIISAVVAVFVFIAVVMITNGVALF